MDGRRDEHLALAAVEELDLVRPADALHHDAGPPLVARMGHAVRIRGLQAHLDAVADGELPKEAGDGGQSLLPGLLGEDAPGSGTGSFGRFDHGYFSRSWISRTSSASTFRGVPSRPARLGSVRPPSPSTHSLMYVPASARSSSSIRPSDDATRRAATIRRVRTRSDLRCATRVGVRWAMARSVATDRASLTFSTSNVPPTVTR